MFRSMGPSADFCSSVVNLLEFWPGFGSKAHLFANLEKIKVEKSANQILNAATSLRLCELYIDSALRLGSLEAPQ